MRGAVVVIGLFCAAAVLADSKAVNIPGYVYTEYGLGEYLYTAESGLTRQRMCGMRSVFDCGVVCGAPLCRTVGKPCGSTECWEGEVCHQEKCHLYDCRKGFKCYESTKLECKDVCKKKMVKKCKTDRYPLLLETNHQELLEERQRFCYSMELDLNKLPCDAIQEVCFRGKHVIASRRGLKLVEEENLLRKTMYKSPKNWGEAFVTDPIKCEIVEEKNCKMKPKKTCKGVCKPVSKVICTDEKCGSDTLVPCQDAFCLPGDECYMPSCEKKCSLTKNYMCW